MMTRRKKFSVHDLGLNADSDASVCMVQHASALIDDTNI
ncbi:hypothetical protein NC652_002986 [Populus alba x Populus x berolinensis]|nr:hypothetical protein NC652_002986 [Populus alba x Populus x berolinensis]